MRYAPQVLHYIHVHKVCQGPFWDQKTGRTDSPVQTPSDSDLASTKCFRSFSKGDHGGWRHHRIDLREDLGENYSSMTKTMVSHHMSLKPSWFKHGMMWLCQNYCIEKENTQLLGNSCSALLDGNLGDTPCWLYIYRDNHIPNALYPHKMAPLLLLLAINFLLDDKVGAVLSTDSTFMATEIKFIRSAWW